MTNRGYKRNQIEDAVARTLNSSADTRNETIRSRIKRLLDLDRRRGRDLAASDCEEATFAFFGAEPPGSGFEVTFSPYEAFALLISMKLMNHNWPQETVVSLLRAARPALEQHHTQILRADPTKLFDRKLIQQRNQNTNYEAINSDPRFLLIVSDAKIRDAKRDAPYPLVFRGEREAFRFMLKEPGRSVTLFELVNPAWEFRDRLDQTHPAKRGRSR